MTDIFEIDGSVLEGGGQILRMSISLSAILGIPVRVKNIRAGRPKPGLAAQHLKGILLVAEMCQARLRGASIGSTEVEFIPGKIKGGKFFADAETAGSVSLMLQVALPCALFAPEQVTLELRGGTNADMAPQIDYMVKIFSPTLKKFGATFWVEILKRGYYPRGGGHVRVKITPVKQLRAVHIVERGALQRVTGWSWSTGSLPLQMAQKMAQAAKHELQDFTSVHIHSYKEGKDMARDNAAGILLMAEVAPNLVLGADALARRGEDVCGVGAEAGGQLRATLHSGACLDPHAQDQVVVYMALAAGESRVRVADLTLHTRTAMHVAQLLAKVQFNVTQQGEHSVLQCVGCGLVNNYID